MLTITSPVANQIFQRSNEKKAVVLLKGTNTIVSEQVKVSIKKVGSSVANYEKSCQVTGLDFAVTIEIESGFYEATFVSATDTQKVKFGIGEVFLATGHSFADGLGGSFVTDERVIFQTNQAQVPLDDSTFKEAPVYQPLKDFALTDSTYSENSGIWGRMCEKLVKALDCPVLLYFSAWGGTSLRHWAIAASGGNATQYAGYNPANDGKGLPYAKTKYILQDSIKKTGIRGLIILHGDNDVNDTQENIVSNYKTLINQCRTDANLSQLPVFLAKSCYDYSTQNQVVRATEQVISDTPYVYSGADIYTIGADGRKGGPTNDFHLNLAGEETASQMFVDSILKVIDKAPASVVPIQIIASQAQNVNNVVKQNKPFLFSLLTFVVLILLRLKFKIPFWSIILVSGFSFLGIYLSGKDINQEIKKLK